MIVDIESRIQGSLKELDVRDPLHVHLAHVVLPKIGIKVKHPRFEVGCLSNNQAIWVYRERKSQVLLVCKFFGKRRFLSEVECRRVLHLEFSNISTLRKKGFSRFPYQVVRPLSKSEEMNCVLVEEFARGHDLDYYLAKAAHENQHQRLFRKLTMLSNFFTVLHNRTKRTDPVNFAKAISYFRELIEMLVKERVADVQIVDQLDGLCGRWRCDNEMWVESSALVHGDVTPTNFFFHPEDGLTVIDLESMHVDDPVIDLGMLAAELRHHFMLRTGQPNDGEPFIGHFLWTYCEDFPDRKHAFRKITHRNRFYMALSELRIARNHYLPWEHRKWLVQEACRCLQ